MVKIKKKSKLFFRITCLCRFGLDPMSKLIGGNLKQLFFFQLSPFAKISTFKIFNHDFSKTITSRNFRLSQLLQDDK